MATENPTGVLSAFGEFPKPVQALRSDGHEAFDAAVF